METIQSVLIGVGEVGKVLEDVVSSLPDLCSLADHTVPVSVSARTDEVDSPKAKTEADEADLSTKSETLLMSPTSASSLLSPKSEALSDLDFDSGSAFPPKSPGAFSTLSLDADDNDDSELLTPRARSKRTRKSKAERKQKAINQAFESGERFSLPYACCKIVHKRTSIITVPLSKDKAEAPCSPDSEPTIIDLEIDGKKEPHKVLRVALRETDDGNDDGEDLYDEMWVIVYFEDNLERFRNALPQREVAFPSGTNRDFGKWPEKYPILGEAAMQGRQAIVTYLLEDLQCSPNVQHGKGLRSPLQLASFYGFIPVVRLLLKFGAKTNSRDLNGETPLQAAICAGHQAVITLIRKYGDERRRASLDDGSDPTSPRPESRQEGGGLGATRHHPADLSTTSPSSNRDKEGKYGFGSGTVRNSDRSWRSQQGGLGSPRGPMSPKESMSPTQKGVWRSRQRRASTNDCEDAREVMYEAAQAQHGTGAGVGYPRSTPPPPRDLSRGSGDSRISRTSSDHRAHQPQYQRSQNRPQSARGPGGDEWPGWAANPGRPSASSVAPSPAVALAVATAAPSVAGSGGEMRASPAPGLVQSACGPRARRSSSMENIAVGLPKDYAGWNRRRSQDGRSDLVDSWRS